MLSTFPRRNSSAVGLICSYTRWHTLKLFKKRPVSSTRAIFFSTRVVNVWNALPAADVDFWLRIFGYISSLNCKGRFVRLCQISIVSSLFYMFYVYFVLYPNLSVSIAVTNYLILGRYKRSPRVYNLSSSLYLLTCFYMRCVFEQIKYHHHQSVQCHFNA